MKRQRLMRCPLTAEQYTAPSATVFPESCYQVAGLALPTSATRHLASYQTAVGGYIEPVTVERPRMTIFANEEGKVRQLPINCRATCRWWMQSPRARGNDLLAGDVALVGSRGGAGATTDLPRGFIELLLATPRYKIEVQTDAEPKDWFDNQMRFKNYFEACRYGFKLAERWIQVRDIRVVAAA